MLSVSEWCLVFLAQAAFSLKCHTGIQQQQSRWLESCASTSSSHSNQHRGRPGQPPHLAAQSGPALRTRSAIQKDLKTKQMASPPPPPAPPFQHEHSTSCQAYLDGDRGAGPHATVHLAKAALPQEGPQLQVLKGLSIVRDHGPLAGHLGRHEAGGHALGAVDGSLAREPGQGVLRQAGSLAQLARQQVRSLVQLTGLQGRSPRCSAGCGSAVQVLGCG